MFAKTGHYKKHNQSLQFYNTAVRGHTFSYFIIGPVSDQVDTIYVTNVSR